MNSKYRTTCKECHTTINIGDPIEKREGNWVHRHCPDQPVKRTIVDDVDDIVIGSRTPSTVDFQGLAHLLESAETIAIKPFTPSKYQQAIFDFIVNGTGHGVVEAVAGSGKTTTLVQALKYLPNAELKRRELTVATDDVMRDVDTAFVAFNKHIATELKKRSPDYVQVSTVHSLGLQNIKAFTGKRYFEPNEFKVDNIMDKFPQLKVERKMMNAEKASRKAKRGNLRKLVSLAKSTLVAYSDFDALELMVDHYGLDLNDDALELFALLPSVMSDCMLMDEIDYDDMIWLPIVHEMPLKKFDYLFVDEAQDLNKLQIAFVLGSIKPSGRIVAVGDRKQSLYGFRGADTEAIPNIIKALKATVLPLSISYRCPTSHIKLAQTLVPQLEAAESAIEGSLERMNEDKFAMTVKQGDMAICRTNAPLITYAFDLIRRGIKAIVRGRDIGQSLVQLIMKFDASNMADFNYKLDEYYQREFERLSRRDGNDMKIQQLQDKVDTLRVIANESTSPDDMCDRIATIFSDDNIGVVFSSVHRAKGLEAERVFILRPDLMPFPKAKQSWEKEQESNCQYVAWTRSKRDLIFVD